MDNFYLVIPSNTTSNTSHINDNTNFEIKLSTPLTFKEQWEVAITEIVLPPWIKEINIPIDTNFGYDIVDVSLNVIDYLKIGNSEKQLLRRIRRRKINETELIEFKNIHYVQIAKNNIEMLRVHLTAADEKPAHVYNKCQITLHFRKV